jgi:succinate dehydrogenase hydrophobic anchor subunit
MTEWEATSGGGHRFLFLMALVSALVMFALLGYVLYFFVMVAHDTRKYTVAMFVVPQVVLFAWVAREMWRGLPGVRIQ